MDTEELDKELRHEFFRLVLDLGIGIQSQLAQLLQEYELTFTQSIFLFRLYGADHVQFKDLVSCQKTSKGAISQIIKVLEIKGLVRREQSREDKRNWYVHLTPKGQKILREINEKQGNEMQFMYLGIEKNTLESLVKNLQLIKINIDEKFKDQA